MEIAPVTRHPVSPGPPDEVVGGPHHCDVNLTLYKAVYPGIGLWPLGGEASGLVFQNGLCLGTQQAID